MLTDSPLFSFPLNLLDLWWAVMVLLLAWFLTYFFSLLRRQKEAAAPVQDPKEPDHWQDYLVRLPRRTDLTVHFGPLAAYYYLDWQERKPNFLPEPGALGLLTGQLGSRVTFVGTGDSKVEISIPLEDIRYLGRSGPLVFQWYSLSLYCETDQGWRIHTFGLSRQQEFLKVLQQVTGLTEATNQDLGPVAVQRYRQDIYGAWWPGDSHRIYLAPDRLLSDWHTMILLDHIRDLAVIPVPGVHLARQALLRISSMTEGVGLETVGFAMLPELAEEWGAALQARTQAPFKVIKGRKKKDGDQQPAAL